MDTDDAAPRISLSCLWQEASTLRRRQQNVHIGKSEAEVTNTKGLQSRYCNVEVNYWQTWSIARPFYDTGFCGYVSRIDLKEFRCWPVLGLQYISVLLMIFLSVKFLIRYLSEIYTYGFVIDWHRWKNYIVTWSSQSAAPLSKLFYRIKKELKFDTSLQDRQTLQFRVSTDVHYLKSRWINFIVVYWQVEEDHGCTIDSLWSLVQDCSLWRLLWPSLVKRSSEWVKPQTDKINTKPL